MRRSLAIAGAVFACAAVGTPLHAQGSGVDQQSACMSGRMGAGVGSPCEDASGVYFSPGGLAMQGSAISVGVTLVRASNTFRYDPGQQPVGTASVVERKPETVPVPQVFASFKVKPRLAAAIGAFAPYGLGLSYPVCPVSDPHCTGTNFEGRYTGYDNSLRAYYLQPTLSYEVVPGRFSIGAGVDFVHSTIEVHRRADAPTIGLRGTDIADAKLAGSGNAITGHVGVVLRASDRTSFGLRYLHSAKVDLSGDADFTQIATGTVFDPLLAAQFVTGGPLADQGISTTIKFPSQLVAGISYRPLEIVNLLFDYQRTTWSSFDQFVIDFANASATDQTLNLNYRNTNTFRFGTQIDWSDALAFRLGYRFNTAATPRATPFLPEGERNYYSAGLGWHPSRALSTDFSFQYIHQPDRRGAVRPDEPTVGVFTAKGMTFGFTLAYHFGARPGMQ
ncbi:MAG TPA: outer membrane protein transport protein [Longimicrobium sp.]|jgi:long-chain fatty acid transport protein|nr:outer membrane protein transport protein [Longimicrobium sp.]